MQTQQKYSFCLNKDTLQSHDSNTCHFTHPRLRQAAQTNQSSSNLNDRMSHIDQGNRLIKILTHLRCRTTLFVSEPKGFKSPSAKSVLELLKATPAMNTRDSLLILRMAVPTIMAIVAPMLRLEAAPVDLARSTDAVAATKSRRLRGVSGWKRLWSSGKRRAGKIAKSSSLSRESKSRRSSSCSQQTRSLMRGFCDGLVLFVIF